MKPRHPNHSSRVLKNLTLTSLLIVGVFLITTTLSEAQNDNSNQSSLPTNSADSQPAEASSQVPADDFEKPENTGESGKKENQSSDRAEVVAVLNSKGEYDRPPDSLPDREKFVRAGIGDSITVKVSRLKETLEEKKVDAKTLVLYLDGYALTGVHPDQPVDLEGGRLHFMLERTPENRKALSILLGGPAFGEFFSFGPALRQRTVTVGDGQNLTFGVAPNSQNFHLVVVRQWSFLVSLVLFGLAVAIFVIKARNDTLIRDINPPLAPKTSKPYSLARVQMAWWFFLVVGSFVFIRLITGDINTITDQALILIGIGTGTALGSAVIDVNKKGELRAKLETLLPKQVALAERVKELKSLTTPTPEQKTELAQKEVQLKIVEEDVAEARNSLTLPQSEDLFTDILTDANGYSFHRFQMAVWTVVLGLVFIASVWRDLAMPEFSGTLLALMGISSGTYLGFKIPEKQVGPDTTNGGNGAGAKENGANGADAEAGDAKEDENEGKT